MGGDRRRLHPLLMPDDADHHTPIADGNGPAASRHPLIQKAMNVNSSVKRLQASHRKERRQPRIVKMFHNAAMSIDRLYQQGQHTVNVRVHLFRRLIHLLSGIIHGMKRQNRHVSNHLIPQFHILNGFFVQKLQNLRRDKFIITVRHPLNVLHISGNFQ